jgi:hypothetical protein
MNKTKRGISSLGTVRTFLKVGTCSETLCNVVDRAYDHPLIIEEHAALPLAGGIMGQGYQCGQLWGAALAAGAQAYRLFGPGPQAEAAAVIAAQRLIEAFRAKNKEINCMELTEISMKNVTARQVLKLMIRGGPMLCFGMAARYASTALREIEATLSDLPGVPLVRPVSCAAILAQRMGLSDLQMAMAAGFAGGIGLSGGACGALGTAIWIMGLEQSKAGMKIDYQSSSGSDVIERFLESSDYEFECSKIVGRKFVDVQDHARYLCDGGCSKIIETLAAQAS